MPKAIDEALERVELEREQRLSEELAIGPNGTSLTLLQRVYRSATLPLNTRMRAATVAIQFEHPKLAVTANVSDEEFGFRLDQAIQRSGTGPKLIEHQPTKVEPQAPAPSKPMLGPVPDKRFRR
jgi:hypothetical protein